MQKSILLVSVLIHMSAFGGIQEELGITIKNSSPEGRYAQQIACKESTKNKIRDYYNIAYDASIYCIEVSLAEFNHSECIRFETNGLFKILLITPSGEVFWGRSNLSKEVKHGRSVCDGVRLSS